MPENRYIDKIRNKLKKHRLAKAILLAEAVSFPVQVQGQTAENMFSGSDEIKSESAENRTKYYFNVQKVDKLSDIPFYDESLDEETRLKQQPFASYSSQLDAVIFVKYEMENPTFEERKKLEEINRMCYSTDVAIHEECHFKDDAFFDEIQDGTTPLLPSDKAEFRMLLEVMAYSAEKNVTFEESVDMFCSQLAENYKNRYALDKSGHIVMALSAEENESGGYTFEKLKENKRDLFERYAIHRNLTSEQLKKFTDFTQTLNLETLNLNNAELTDLRFGRELENMCKMLKDSYYLQEIPQNWVETNRPTNKFDFDFLSAEAAIIKDTTQR